jgi:hypothetical protein
MFCRQCGQENDENTYRCVRCGYQIHSAPVPLETGETIPNYLIFAAISIALAALCSFCYCLPIGLPFGILAVIYSAQVNGRVQAGDVQGARNSAKQAKMWCMVSVGISLGGFALYLAFMSLRVFSQMRGRP